MTSTVGTLTMYARMWSPISIEHVCAGTGERLSLEVSSNAGTSYSTLVHGASSNSFQFAYDFMEVPPVSFGSFYVNGTSDLPKRLILPKLKGADLAGLYDVLNNNELDNQMQVIQANTDDVRELRKRKAATVNSTAVLYHKVTSGQSLNSVADKYGVEVQDLKVWNALKSKTIVPGQRLKIYTSKRAVLKAPTSFLSYKVKRGDTLSEIAEKFDGATVQSIKRDNNLAKAGLQTGMVLKISKG